MKKNIDSNTVTSFGDEWTRYDQSKLTMSEADGIFNDYFGIFPWDGLPVNPCGFDMGCGSGRWAAIVANKVGHLCCIDPSSAIEVAKQRLSQFDNVTFYKSSVDDNVLPANSQDFGYSLGVLHHLPDTKQGLSECVKMLKPGAPFLVYLYYSFDNRSTLFRLIWGLSNLLRKLVCKLPAPLKSLVTNMIGYAVYFPLARASYLLDKMGINTDNIPLSYYKNRSLFTMITDSRDRFGTPLEHRFSRKEIEKMMLEVGLNKITFSEKAPFWCALGYKA